MVNCCYKIPGTELTGFRNDFRVSENKIDPWLNTIFWTTIQNSDPVFVLRYDDGTYEAMPYDIASAHNIYCANWFSEKWT